MRGCLMQEPATLPSWANLGAFLVVLCEQQNNVYVFVFRAVISLVNACVKILKHKNVRARERRTTER